MQFVYRNVQVESHSMQKIIYDFLRSSRSFFGYGGNILYILFYRKNLKYNIFIPEEVTLERQGIPTLVNYVHDLSQYVLPFTKY